MSEQMAEVLYRRLKAVQREFGMARLELGVLLEVFRTNEALWQGRAASFNAFLEEERIQPNGANQFMRIAKRYVLELRLPEADLAELACVNFRTLDAAAKIITEENKDEIIGILTALGERDAKAALSEMVSAVEDGAVQPQEANRLPPPVQSLLGKYRDMPDDYRLQFIEQLQRGGRRQGS